MIVLKNAILGIKPMSAPAKFTTRGLHFITVCDRLIDFVQHEPAQNKRIQQCIRSILDRQYTQASSEELQQRITALEQLPLEKGSKLQSRIARVVRKLHRLIPQQPTTPIVPSAVATTVPRGMSNSSGSSCFLISLCQLLQTEALRKYIVDQLSDSLWQVLAARNPDSTAIRAAITKYTSFGHQVSAAHLDPMTDQHDPTEVLGALFAAIDSKTTQTTTTPVTPPTSPTPAFTPPKLSYLSRFVHFLVGSYCTIKNWMYQIFLYLLGPEEDPNVILPTPPLLYTPHVDPARIASRQAKTSFQQNPLLMHLTKCMTFKHPQNGTLIRTSQRTDPVGFLPIPLAKSGKPQFFSALFKAAIIDEEVIKDPTETIHIAHVFAQLPEHMLFSFKRVSYPNGPTAAPEKLSDPIENIHLNFTLPQEALSAETFQNSGSKEYELLSFLSHQGNSDHSGHYVAYRKESDGWYHFNDGATPQKCTEEQIKEAVKHSYLVFYQRKK